MGEYSISTVPYVVQINTIQKYYYGAEKQKIDNKGI